MQLGVVPKPLRCVNCAEPILIDEEMVEVDNDLDEYRHVRECEAWEPRGPVSDGTLPCPVRHNDVPCTKTIPSGWHENEGHPGGHWFQRPEDAERMATEHYDVFAAISGRPFEMHRPEDCPGRPACNWWDLP